MKLQDGRILLTYGSRISGMCGIQARLTEDNGGSWSDPLLLLNGLNTPEVGYPTTAQTDDISRARELPGYGPRIGFEQGLRLDIDWYQANL